MLNFWECERLLTGKKTSKKLENNTYLEKLGEDAFGVLLHGTYVVRVHRDGTYTLSAGGRWQTQTTKDRINKYSPVRIDQEKKKWYIGNIPFFDGMRVDKAGTILNEQDRPV